MHFLKGPHNLYANKINHSRAVFTRISRHRPDTNSLRQDFRARETYKIIGPDEFIEVFEIAEPGKDFEVYSENHFKRKK